MSGRLKGLRSAPRGRGVRTFNEQGRGHCKNRTLVDAQQVHAVCLHYADWGVMLPPAEQSHRYSTTLHFVPLFALLCASE